MNTIADRVALGATWLDLHYPGWVDAIDLDTLDISNCTSCVLGQVYTACIPADEQNQLIAQVVRMNWYAEHDEGFEEFKAEFVESIQDGVYGGYNILLRVHDLIEGGALQGFAVGDPGPVCDGEGWEDNLLRIQAKAQVEYANLLDEWTRVIIGRRRDASQKALAGELANLDIITPETFQVYATAA